MNAVLTLLRKALVPYLLILALYRTVLPQTRHTLKNMRRVGNFSKPYAYVGLLCDDEFADAAFAAVYSLAELRDHTKSDIIILTTPEVSSSVKNSLKSLGSITVDITEPVRYPFRVTRARLAIKKPCRYSKLLLWKMTQYSRVVYFDIDLLFLKNVDELFSHPELSAVPDSNPPDKFNSGIFVAEPSLETFEKMMQHIDLPSYNVGDQGFLNAFYKDWYTESSEKHLPYIYNAMVRNSNFMFWKSVEDNIKVLHYSGESKPWNHMRDTYAAQHGLASFNKKYLNMWLSAKVKAEEHIMCDRQRLSSELLQTKVTMVISTYNRTAALINLVKYYSTFDLVHEFVIIWGNSDTKPLTAADFYAEDTENKKVNIVASGRDKLSERFLPSSLIKTTCVVIADDDILVSRERFNQAFYTWQDDTEKLVGMFPRSHKLTFDHMEYVQGPHHTYSIILTKFMFISLRYLHEFTCTMPKTIRDYVDDRKNCEDLAMNLMIASHKSHHAVYVEDPEKIDLGTYDGLSSRNTHDADRSTCLTVLWKMFGEPILEQTNFAISNGGTRRAFVQDHFVRDTVESIEEHIIALQSAQRAQ